MKTKFEFVRSETYGGVKYLVWEAKSYGYYRGLAITPGSNISFPADWFWRYRCD